MKKIYLDNAATTPVLSEALERMMPYFSGIFGNASSPHTFGQEAKKGLELARTQVARAIGANEKEIVFTSGGTEANNMALLGVAQRYRSKGNHIITTSVEHHAVLHVCEELEKQGFEVTYLPVDEYGSVTAKQVEEAITDQTILVSVMFANNEVGTIMPIADIGALCKAKGVLFHTDAVQAVGHMPIDVKAMNIDLLSMASHKFHGPKGVGALYVKGGVNLNPMLLGGSHERNRRAGTENVAGIVGMGAALEIAVNNMDAVSKRMLHLREKLMRSIEESIPDVKLNGHPENRLPNNVNYSIRFIEGESILLMLDLNGIAASSGSACTSGSLDPSHVLLAMGLSHEIAHGSLRLTLGAQTTEEEIDYAISILPGIIKKLRAMSPLYNV